MSVASQRRALQKRERLIGVIEQLYPPDMGEEGRDLLIDALCITWRELPLPVLSELHQRNMARENSR